jgi:hypothetical protein
VDARVFWPSCDGALQPADRSGVAGPGG